MTKSNFTILGGGAWGLALANLLTENGHKVRVWEHNPEYVELLISSRSNPHLLRDVIMRDEITFAHRMENVLTSATDHIIYAVPSQFLRPVVRQSSILLAELSNVKSVVNVAKGIEENTMKRMSEVIREELPSRYHSSVFTLSGPSHAEEVSRRIPTAVVIAGTDAERLTELQVLFSNDYFRVYRSEDMIGVEYGGAVKNIIAIAAGIIDGLGYGDNTKGALIARGLAEIQKLGVALGANNDTIMGLSGIGDLYATAASTHSRNRYVGSEIGKGRTLPDILASMSAVAEGVATTRSVYELKNFHKVEMPIVDQVYMVLFEQKPPKQAITDLMTRTLKAE